MQLTKLSPWGLNILLKWPVFNDNYKKKKKKTEKEESKNHYEGKIKCRIKTRLSSKA